LAYFTSLKKGTLIKNIITLKLISVGQTYTL